MKMLTVKLPDGSVWAVPVSIIANSRATHYASEFDGSITRSLDEDTLPLFEQSDFEIEDWAVNNMNWTDFDGHQIKIKEAPPTDFQEAWMCGEKDVIDFLSTVDMKVSA